MKVNCPNCGAEHDITGYSGMKERLNQYGRKEVVFQVQGMSWIKWKDGKFHCLKCGHSFSFQEGTHQ